MNPKKMTILEKARKVLELGQIEADPEYPYLWWVTSLTSPTQYRVQIVKNVQVVTEEEEDVILTCTCPHGLKAGGGKAHCYHVTAALLSLSK